MKKILSAVLAVIMLLSLGLASAEDVKSGHVVVPYDARTSITYELPEEYETASTSHSGQMLIIDLKSLKKPEMVLVVGSDEEYATLEKLNDLSEEELQAYIDSLCEDWGKVETYVLDTDYGTKFILIDELSADIDQCQIQGVYKGFTICLYIIRTDGSQITEEDYHVAMKFLSEVWITGLE